MSDREYWRAPGGRSWHARYPDTVYRGLCGYYRGTRPPNFTPIETADRLPPDGHLCGNCARIIAARTDVEE